MDLAALAGARVMHATNPRLFEPLTVDGGPNPRHLTRDAYLELARDAAERVAEANGVDHPEIRFPDGETFAPVRIRVEGREVVEVRRGDERREVPIEVVAEAELAPAATGRHGRRRLRWPARLPAGQADAAGRGARLRPHGAGGREDGVTLLVSSGFRSDAEQAVLFAANPDPKWVAAPGKSLHRNATELDLGPRSAYGWLARNAMRFHFVQRYPHQPLAIRLHAARARHCGAPGRRRSAGQRDGASRRRRLRLDAGPQPASDEMLERRCSPRRSTRKATSTRSADSGGGAGTLQFDGGHGEVDGRVGVVAPASSIDTAAAHRRADRPRRSGSSRSHWPRQRRPRGGGRLQAAHPAVRGDARRSAAGSLGRPWERRGRPRGWVRRSALCVDEDRRGCPTLPPPPRTPASRHRSGPSAGDGPGDALDREYGVSAS